MGSRAPSEDQGKNDENCDRRKGRNFFGKGSNEENLAYAMRQGINTLERLDRMIMALEVRRDRVYRESKRRGGSAAPLRRAGEQIEDGEFCEVGQEDPVQKRAA
jgi:hypothetical protein